MPACGALLVPPWDAAVQVLSAAAEQRQQRSARLDALLLFCDAVILGSSTVSAASAQLGCSRSALDNVRYVEPSPKTPVNRRFCGS